MKKNKRPNILFAIADDASHLGSRMADFIETPACDYVIENGVFFNNSFTSNPKCAPSRASILTGLHTWQLEEACTHWCDFPNRFDLYPDILEKAGYHIGYTGKGWAPGTFGKLSRNPAGIVYNEKKLLPPKNTEISNIDYTENFKEFLSEKKEEEPFYFWYGGQEPHRKYIPGEGLRGGKDPSKITIPTYLPQDDVVGYDLLDYGYEIDYFDYHLGMMIDLLRERGELNNTLIVVTSDNGMPFPRVKGNMYESDFNLPLMMCFGDKVKGNRTVDDIVQFIDFMPTFLEIAGIKYKQPLAGKSLTDILYSVEEGIVNPERNFAVMGRERHDVGYEKDRGYPVRVLRTPEYLYVKNYEPNMWPAGNPETGYTGCDGSPTKDFILANKDNSAGYKFYQWAFAKNPAEELYNIKNDKECLNNLAEEEKYQSIKEKLEEEMLSYLEKTKDPRIVGDGEVFNSYQYMGKGKHDWESYLNGTWERQKY